jgi:NAD(P)-dependent dehydrogenase (short-subunit alcohol dehydrogenase family)
VGTMKGLSGKSVVVTGGGSGIGRAACKLLAEAGCLVTVADLNDEGGQESVANIRASGKGQAQFVRTNVADEASVKAMIASAETAFGKLDGAINSAGVPQSGRPLAEITLDQWNRIHDVNLRGMFLCIKYQILAMQRAGSGSIVAIASSAAVTGVPNSSEYCGSKAGVTGLVRAGAVDYADKGIRVNAILPGGTWTPMVEGAIKLDPALGKIVESFPMKRFAQPHEIAAAAVWLVSDEASYVTGASLLVDGALTVI